MQTFVSAFTVLVSRLIQPVLLQNSGNTQRILLLSAMLIVSWAEEQNRPPNVLFIVADDLGIFRIL